TLHALEPPRASLARRGNAREQVLRHGTRALRRRRRLSPARGSRLKARLGTYRSAVRRQLARPPWTPRLLLLRLSKETGRRSSGPDEGAARSGRARAHLGGGRSVSRDAPLARTVSRRPARTRLHGCPSRAVGTHLERG